MDFKFSKNSDESQQQEAPGEKKKQSALLVLLLILVGGFTYVYFFTGLIKPQTADAPAPAPAAQDAKLPLPPREGEPAKPGVKAPENADGAKSAPATAAKPAAEPAKPAESAAAKPAAAPAKPADAPAVAADTAPAKPKEEAKNPEATKPSGKQPLPARAADKKGDTSAAAKTEAKKPATEAKKPAAEAKKPAVADTKSAPATVAVKKPVSTGPAKQEAGTKAKTSATDSWSLTVGNYVLEDALSADMGRVRKAGFKPVVKPSERRKTTMNRLFVSEFNDRAAALSTMGTLKRHTSDVFIIEQGGRFAVYAGSYLQSDAANSEQERLKAAGITSTLKRVDIAIPSQSLTVGPFKSRKEADAALGRLKNAGIKAALLKK